MVGCFVLELKRAETTSGERPWRPRVGSRGGELPPAFYGLVNAVDSELGDRLHAASGRAPYTAGCFKLRSGGDGLRLRFTALTREVFAALSASLFARLTGGERLRLGGEPFELVRFTFDGADEPLAGLSDYPRLLPPTPPRHLSFRFLTPATFRAGDANLPLPLPQSVFRGLWEKWNAFAPPDLRMDREVLTVAEKHVVPCAFRVRSAERQVKQGKVVGFFGNCRYEILGDQSPEVAQALGALTNYAFYAGVGAKTTMGLGQALTECAPSV